MNRARSNSTLLQDQALQLEQIKRTLDESANTDSQQNNCLLNHENFVEVIEWNESEVKSLKSIADHHTKKTPYKLHLSSSEKIMEIMKLYSLSFPETNYFVYLLKNNNEIKKGKYSSKIKKIEAGAREDGIEFKVTLNMDFDTAPENVERYLIEELADFFGVPGEKDKFIFRKIERGSVIVIILITLAGLAAIALTAGFLCKKSTTLDKKYFNLLLGLGLSFGGAAVGGGIGLTTGPLAPVGVGVGCALGAITGALTSLIIIKTIQGGPVRITASKSQTGYEVSVEFSEINNGDDISE